MSKSRPTHQRLFTGSILFGIVLLVVLMLPTSVMAEDYQGHLYQDAIQEGVNEGLIDLDDGDFYPDQIITKSEWVRWVTRYFGLSKIASEGFADVAADSKYYEDFLIAKEAGLILPDEEGLAHPEAGVSLEDAVWGVVTLLHLDIEQEQTGLLSIEDAADITPGKESAIRLALAKHWIRLNEEDRIFPIRDMTRAEAVSFLDNVTGLRLLTSQTYGSALETKTLEENLSIYGTEVMLQRMESNDDIIVYQKAGGGHLTLSKVNLQGDVIVLGAGDFTLELKDSLVREVKTFNPYGTTKVIRDARSHIENFVQTTPIVLEVTDEAPVTHETETPDTVKWVILAFVVLLLALLVYGAKESEQTLFLSEGIGKVYRLPGLAGWKEVEIHNPAPTVLLAQMQRGRLRLQGLQEGKVTIILLRADDEKMKKRKDRPQMVLHVVVVKQAKHDKDVGTEDILR